MPSRGRQEWQAGMQWGGMPVTCQGWRADVLVPSVVPPASWASVWGGVRLARCAAPWVGGRVQ